MKLWEAIIYSILGGITELLPISFSGHAAAFQNAFHMSPLHQGGGLYIRAAISLGIVLALSSGFRAESSPYEALRHRTHRTRSRRREEDGLQRRITLLSIFAAIPMLFSFLFLASADRLTRLPYVAGLFFLNGTLIYLCCKGPMGIRSGKEVTMTDTILVGFARMLSVFPGLSAAGSSICVGRARGFDSSFNFRFTYSLSLVFHVVSFVYYLFRAFFYGSLSWAILLFCILAILITAVIGYLALQYVRNLLEKNKLSFFAYYCWDAAVIVLILAIING